MVSKLVMIIQYKKNSEIMFFLNIINVSMHGYTTTHYKINTTISNVNPALNHDIKMYPTGQLVMSVKL